MHSTTETPAGIESPADLLRFRFPSAQLLDAAAGLFPAPAVTSRRGFQLVAPASWSESAAGYAEGPFPHLELGPGMVRLFRRDDAALERSRHLAAERADAEFRRRGALTRAQLFQPMVWAPDSDEAGDGPAGRGRVAAWSRKSRARLVRTLLSLDLSELTAGAQLPVMVTLTLPGRWREVTRDAGAAARKFDNFRRAYARRWGTPRWVWKREFQRRGAPHWHLWMVPPTADLATFKTWLSQAWTTALDVTDPEERRLSLAAGTNVSQAEGMKARDPKRLAVYFLKESLGGEGKAYQNEPPAGWDTSGRYWGVAGIRAQLREVDVEPEAAVLLWRVMRKVRRSHSVTREVSVRRVNYKTGVVRYRKVRRRVSAGGTAGWVAVNDGAAFGSQLARYLAAAESTGPADHT